MVRWRANESAERTQYRLRVSDLGRGASAGARTSQVGATGPGGLAWTTCKTMRRTDIKLCVDSY